MPHVLYFNCYLSLNGKKHCNLGDNVHYSSRTLQSRKAQNIPKLASTTQNRYLKVAWPKENCITGYIQSFGRDRY